MSLDLLVVYLVDSVLMLMIYSNIEINEAYKMSVWHATVKPKT